MGEFQFTVPAALLDEAVKALRTGKSFSLTRWDGSEARLSIQARKGKRGDARIAGYLFPLIGGKFILTLVIPPQASTEEVRSTLLHELVHVLDPSDRTDEEFALAEAAALDEASGGEENRKRAHYNRPSELLAYRYQIQHEMETEGRSPTYAWLKEYLTPANRVKLKPKR